MCGPSEDLCVSSWGAPSGQRTCPPRPTLGPGELGKAKMAVPVQPHLGGYRLGPQPSWDPLAQCSPLESWGGPESALGWEGRPGRGELLTPTAVLLSSESQHVPTGRIPVSDPVEFTRVMTALGDIPPAQSDT